MITAYHFTADKLRDGRPVPPIGEKLVHEGEIVWCESGLYAVRKPHKALSLASGSLLHMVECDQIEDEDDFKFVCRERTIIKSIDATDLLRRFAADQALSVAHLWRMPDAVRQYLTTLDDGLREAARSASSTVTSGYWSDAEAARLVAESVTFKGDKGATDAPWAAWTACCHANGPRRPGKMTDACDDFDARVYKAFGEVDK